MCFIFFGYGVENDVCFGKKFMLDLGYDFFQLFVMFVDKNCIGIGINGGICFKKVIDDGGNVWSIEMLVVDFYQLFVFGVDFKRCDMQMGKL